MEHYIFGALYGVMSIIFIMSYIVVVYLIATTKSLRSQSYNLIVLHLTLADLLQLIFNGISSTCFLFWPAVYESHHLVNKICGALALTGWFLYCTLANLLAFNRFMHVIFRTKFEVYFSIFRTKIYIFVIWIYVICIFLSFTLHPDVCFCFVMDVYSWVYCIESWQGRLAKSIDFYTDTLHVLCMAIWYSCIYVHLKSKTNVVNVVGSNGQRITKDKRLLLQASILCLVLCLVIATFYFLPYISHHRFAYAATNAIWLLSSGMNSVIYLTLNKTMRDRFASMWNEVRKKCACV